MIIRCGYRGSTTGALIEDPTFRTNIKGASGAGLKVGIYFFTQAVNEVEAVEEASMVLGLIKGYNISYPVFLDVESSGGRADGIDASTRTAVCRAFCQTIQNSGYKSGIYANKTWLNERWMHRDFPDTKSGWPNMRRPRPIPEPNMICGSIPPKELLQGSREM